MEIMVLNNEYKKDQKVDETNNKKRIISLSISSDLLVYTDGFQLYLNNFPQLTEIYSSYKKAVKRAIFMKENNCTYILCITDSKIQLLDPFKKFTVIAESKHFDYELKDIIVIEDNAFLLTVKEGKESFLFKLKFKGNSIETLKNAYFSHDAFCSMNATSTSILLGSNFGDIIILDRFSLRKKKTFFHVHNLPITSICIVDDFIITGSLDYNICLTKYVDSSNKKYNLIFSFIIIFLCFFISYFLEII